MTVVLLLRHQTVAPWLLELRLNTLTWLWHKIIPPLSCFLQLYYAFKTNPAAEHLQESKPWNPTWERLGVESGHKHHVGHVAHTHTHTNINAPWKWELCYVEALTPTFSRGQLSSLSWGTSERDSSVDGSLSPSLCSLSMINMAILFSRHL